MLATTNPQNLSSAPDARTRAPRRLLPPDAPHPPLRRGGARAYAQGKIGGFLHLYIGQEAVAVGACAALTPDDYVVTTYRDHGLALAKGMAAKR